MKYTLLDMTQTIMSSMDSDEVNSINDTTESLQVATVIRTAYYDLVDRLNLPEHYSIVTLDASGDSLKPTLMTLPTHVNYLKWLQYDRASVDEPDTNMHELTFVSIEEFLRMTDQMDIDESDVGSFSQTIGSDIFTIRYSNDETPTYYTTFDDHYVLFNSYDSAVDSTLQKSKTRALARKNFTFDMEDDFIPTLDDNIFPLLLNEAKSLAWLELKQTQHPKAEQNARRGWLKSQKSKFDIEGLTDFDQLPDFGRGTTRYRRRFLAGT